MSDSNVEEESLISQDDIDKLLDSSSIEETEGKIESGNDGDSDMDELGELSQDDIDNLMNGSTLDSTAEDIEDDSLDDDMGELSQDDIDSLLGGNDPLGENDPVEDEAAELSQDDIDNLMNTDADTDSGDDEDIELISQDDIDRLMNPSAEDSISLPENDDISFVDPEDPDDADELISMGDVQSLMNESKGEGDKVNGEDNEGQLTAEVEPAEIEPVEVEPAEVEPVEIVQVEADSAVDDYVIDASDAFDVSDCLITQETMDELIGNAPEPEETSDPVVLDAEIESDPVPPELEEPITSNLEEDDFAMEASSDELDDLLKTEADEEDDPEFDWENQDKDDVSQEDIDALLQEEPDDEDILEDEDDILISQDDIDTLLMAADPEDEDVLGDFMGDDMDASLDDDFDYEDVLDNDEITDQDGDQVVLERLDDTEADETGSTESGKGWKNWYKSRLVVATASAILVLGISVPSIYFLFFSKDPGEMPEKQIVPLVLEEQGRNIEVASVDIDAKGTPDIRKSGTILLKDFVVLSSELSKDMAYVTADISIDYSDQRAYHEINNNLSFYRDLIYESIQKSLVWEKRNEVTQNDLIWGVETTLKKVLPPHYIEKVSFKSFNAS